MPASAFPTALGSVEKPNVKTIDIITATVKAPAVANVEGAGPTVYVGSYDRNLYALDARTGAVRWTARAGGRISGGPTVVGRIVYFADLDSKSSYGVGAATGKLVFKRNTGAYNPITSDGRRIYLTGYSSFQALEPVK